jgi:hypothetical protein
VIILNERLNRADEVIQRLRTPRRIKQILSGVVRFGISAGLTPEETGELFAELNDSTAESFAYTHSGLADGETVKLAGRSLRGDKK